MKLLLSVGGRLLEPHRSKICKALAMTSEIDSLLLEDPLQWLTVERAGLISAIERASTTHQWDIAWELACLLKTFFELRPRWDDWEHTIGWHWTPRSVQAIRMAACVSRNIGLMHVYRGEWGPARIHFDRALVIFRKVRDRRWEAATLLSLGDLHRRLIEWPEALACYDAALPM
jgi:Tetratricopeptide repeat